MSEFDRLLIITIAIGVIGAGALIGVFRNMKPGFGPMNLRAVGIVLVATLAGLLATIDANARTAAFGMLGAVAGYLFGKDSGRRDTDGRDPP